MGTRNRFNPCFPCCVDNSPCDKCSSQDTTRTITLDNFMFGCCDFGTEPVLNGSFVLVQPSPLSYPCLYEAWTGTVPCRNTYQYGDRGQVWGRIRLTATTLDNGNYGWRCYVELGVLFPWWVFFYKCNGAALTFEWDSGDSAVFDCTVPHTLDLVDVAYSDTLDGYANLSNVTCELT